MVTFKKEEFVFVEKFYEHLMNAFIEKKINNEWVDFMQSYDYENKNSLRTYGLYSMSLSPIGIKEYGSLVKKKWFVEY